jgi:acyl dehydratase
VSDFVGTVVDRVGFDVEKGKIKEFARATFAEDSVHADPDAAAEAGFGAVLATATHVVVAGHHRDQGDFVARLGLERSRVVVGSVRWHYERPLREGDSLVGTRTVVADENKQNRRGAMRLVTLETEFVDGAGKVAARQQEVLIERGQQ